MTSTGERVLARLLPRERSVLMLLCSEGVPNKKIAQRMGISEQTVKNHLRSIYALLGVFNRAELLIFAFHHGIAPCPCTGQRASGEQA